MWSVIADTLIPSLGPLCFLVGLIAWVPAERRILSGYRRQCWE